MSHIVTVTTKIRDAAAVRAACRRLRLPEPVEGATKLFNGKVTGLAVQLPNWRYAIVCDTASGEVRFDNYQGRWGDQKELDRFLQVYACEKSTHSQCTSCYGFSCLVTRGNSSHFCLAS